MLRGIMDILLKQLKAPNASKFRLIAPIPTIYKFAVAIADKVRSFCDDDNILTEEQKECFQSLWGIKDLPRDYLL